MKRLDDLKTSKADDHVHTLKKLTNVYKVTFYKEFFNNFQRFEILAIRKMIPVE